MCKLERLCVRVFVCPRRRRRRRRRERDTTETPGKRPPSNNSESFLTSASASTRNSVACSIRSVGFSLGARASASAGDASDATNASLIWSRSCRSVRRRRRRRFPFMHVNSKAHLATAPAAAAAELSSAVSIHLSDDDDDDDAECEEGKKRPSCALALSLAALLPRHRSAKRDAARNLPARPPAVVVVAAAAGLSGRVYYGETTKTARSERTKSASKLVTFGYSRQHHLEATRLGFARLGSIHLCERVCVVRGAPSSGSRPLPGCH